MDNTLILVRASLPQPSPLLEPPEEYREKVAEMCCAFSAFSAVFGLNSWKICAGIQEGGEYAGHKLVEGVVELDWGTLVPATFTIRSFVETEEDVPVIGGITQVADQIFEHCFGCVTRELSDSTLKLIALIGELRNRFYPLKYSAFIELWMWPNYLAADARVLCWIDNRSFEEEVDFNDSLAMNTAMVNLRMFVKTTIEQLLERENTARTVRTLPPPVSPTTPTEPEEVASS